MSHSLLHKTYEDIYRCCSLSAQECSSQKMLFGTVSITLFLVALVRLYTVFSSDKRFILAPVKVQPEKQREVLQHQEGAGM